MKKIIVIALLMLATLAIQAASSSDKIQHAQEDIARLRSELKRVQNERAELKAQYENQNFFQKMFGTAEWMYGTLESEEKHFADELKDAETKLQQLLALQK
jgi:septal ring factor EnvC (AmiA/AmiB activator)